MPASFCSASKVVVYRLSHQHISFSEITDHFSWNYRSCSILKTVETWDKWYEGSGVGRRVRKIMGDRLSEHDIHTYIPLVGHNRSFYKTCALKGHLGLRFSFLKKHFTFHIFPLLKYMKNYLNNTWVMQSQGKHWAWWIWFALRESIIETFILINDINIPDP